MKNITVGSNQLVKTITEALSLIAPNEKAIITLKSGVYKEKLTLTSSNLTIIGESPKSTIITFDDYANKIHSDGRDYNTFRTYTLNVLGDHITFRNVTIENSSYDSIEKGQAVALSVYGNYFSMDNCILKSEQDTIFLGPLPDDLKVRYTHFLTPQELFIEGERIHKFTNCEIYGAVDFIFGTSSALFRNCKIVSIYRNHKTGFVAAPAHSLAQRHGFIFFQCQFTAESNVPNDSFYLARPWREFGKCVFINNAYGPHIKLEGFEKWKMVDPNLYSRLYEYPYLPGRVSWTRFLDTYEFESYLTFIKSHFTY